MDILKRPYPVAVPGEILKYGYDYDRRVFVLEWNCDSTDDYSIISAPDKLRGVTVTEEYIFKPLVKGGIAGHLKIMMHNSEKNWLKISL